MSHVDNMHMILASSMEDLKNEKITSLDNQKVTRAFQEKGALPHA